MERIAIAHTEAWFLKKCCSPNLKMETPPRAFDCIHTDKYAESKRVLFVLPKLLFLQFHLKIELPDTTVCFSTKSHHLNISPFSCLAHLSIDNRKRTPKIHPRSTSLPAHVHIYGAQRRIHILPGGRDWHCNTPPPAPPCPFPE